MAEKKREKALDLARAPTNQLPVVLKENESKDRAFARVALDPTVGAAADISRLCKSLFSPTETPIGDTAAVLREQIDRVKLGDMTPADEMLVAQAATLNALFGQLMRRSSANMEAGYLQASETYMRLALKAQAQARSTWETISKIHNPPQPTFIRQANLANGPQQVNNGVSDSVSAPERAHAREMETPPNELNGVSYEPAVDAGAPASHVGGGGAVEAVGAIDGTAHG